MLPEYQDELQKDFEVTIYPSNTYRIDLEKKRIIGIIDGLESVKQAVYLILNTERFVHAIYSWNYGAELVQLIGQSPPLVYAKIKDYIAEALQQDDRIQVVRDFKFQRKGSKVAVSFSVISIYGEFESGVEVMV